MKTNSIALPGLVWLLVPFTALAQQVQGSTPQTPPAWYGYGPWQMWHGDWSFWWIFPLLMFLMMIACAIMMVRALRSGAGPMHCGWGHARPPASSGATDPAASALQLLDERFARGEMEQHEYEQKRAALGWRPGKMP